MKIPRKPRQKTACGGEARSVHGNLPKVITTGDTLIVQKKIKKTIGGNTHSEKYFYRVV